MNSNTPIKFLLVTGVVVASVIGIITTAQDEKGFHSIFDGKSLEGWVGEKALWKIEDKAITGTTTAEAPIKGNTFLVCEAGEVDDFELKLEYKIENGNSGIQVRSFRRGGPDKPFVIGGYQADFEAGTQWSGTIYGEGYHGILAKRGQSRKRIEGETFEDLKAVGDPAELQTHIKTGEWNSYHITAKGNQITTRINGKVMAELVDEAPDARRSGLLALQLHAGPAMKVQFRDIKLKRLALEDRKKVVFIAGKPSHPARTHEHNAGCLLLTKQINEHHADKMVATTYTNGWPSDPSAFQNADSVVMFADGGQRHPAFFHLKTLEALRNRGVGVGAIHYAVEMVPGETNDMLASCIGGAFEIDYSVNPHWVAEFGNYPKHPTAYGLKPFGINDEWYFNMRFVKGMKGVTPILSAVPPAETMSRKDGHHSGNPEVRKMVEAGDKQHVGWVYEREADGGRGFGTSGAHYHDNWANDDFRTFVLNATAWISKVEIPEAGIVTPTPTKAELDANLDPKPARKPKKAPKKPAEKKKAA